MRAIKVISPCLCLDAKDKTSYQSIKTLWRKVNICVHKGNFFNTISLVILKKRC